jgi:arylsulfatase A-like enzyme
MSDGRAFSMRLRPRLLGLLAGGLALGPVRGVAAQPQRPDIVLILTDDLQASDLDVMPKTRAALGGAGTTFPNMFASTPLCSPARASILTGQLAHNHGLLGNNGDTGGWPRYATLGLGTRSLQVPLRAAGYRTGLIGKLLNGVPGSGHVAPGWDHTFVQTDFQYYGFRVNVDGSGRKVGKKQYSTSALRQEAVAFIHATPPGQPLFLHVSPIAPHNVPRSPRKLAKKFRRAKLAGTPDLNESDVSDKPGYLRGRGGLKKKRRRFLNEHHRNRLRSLLPVDDLVAAVVGALAQTGRLERAYIFFLGDNGMLLGHHRHVGKTVPYDRGARTPLLARGPGFAAGHVDDRLGLQVDVTATIAELTGIAMPDLDGASLLGPSARDDLLLEWLGAPEAQNDRFYSPSAPNYTALRTKDRLYVEYVTGERELYTYGDDPHELRNLLAAWEGHSPSAAAEDMASSMNSRLAALRHCAGASCV